MKNAEKVLKDTKKSISQDFASKEEMQELKKLEEEKLKLKEAKRLFEAIMKIADERDEFEYKYNKALEEISEMKALFEVQASIAKELDFDTDMKMTRFKDTYYVPNTMEITANIGEPKRIDLRYIEATKYLDRYLVKDGGE